MTLDLWLLPLGNSGNHAWLFGKTALEDTGKGQASIWERIIWFWACSSSSSSSTLASLIWTLRRNTPEDSLPQIIGTDRANQDKAKRCKKTQHDKRKARRLAGEKSSKHSIQFRKELSSGFGICREVLQTTAKRSLEIKAAKKPPMNKSRRRWERKEDNPGALSTTRGVKGSRAHRVPDRELRWNRAVANFSLGWFHGGKIETLIWNFLASQYFQHKT